MGRLSTFLAAGLASALVWDIVVAPRILDTNSASATILATGDASIATPTLGTSAAVNRTHKSGRLIGSPSTNVVHSSIATVELGPDGTIVLRDLAGDTVFTSDPSARRSAIAKNVTMPQLTVQTSARKAPETVGPLSPVQSAPAVTPEPSPSTTISIGRGRETKRPAGCDPAFSPIAAPQLGHIFGRCITTIETPTRLALAQ